MVDEKLRMAVMRDMRDARPMEDDKIMVVEYDEMAKTNDLVVKSNGPAER